MLQAGELLPRPQGESLEAEGRILLSQGRERERGGEGLREKEKAKFRERERKGKRDRQTGS